MSKYIVVLSTFLFLSCESAKTESKEKIVPANFQSEYWESIVGPYASDSIARVVDKSNGNICYIVYHVDGVGINCMENRPK